MPKTAKKAKRKLGRSEAIPAEELLDRCRTLKWFLEDNWGRIGLELRRIRQPDDVIAVLRLVPGVEGRRPFCDQPAVCLLNEGTSKVEWRALRLTRKQHKNAIETADRLWSEYHSARQKAEAAATAFKAVISEFGAVIGLSQFLVVVILIAKQLRIEELASNLNQLEPSFRLTQKDKQMLKERLLRQEAWYARNEVVSFVKERRYEKTPMNFAKALAGLPECGWLRSHRRCSEIQDESLVPTTFNYQLFEILRMTVKKMKRIDLRTLLWALRNKSYSLKTGCKEFDIPGKLNDHKPTGSVDLDEIEYCRQDVRATLAGLNILSGPGAMGCRSNSCFAAFSRPAVARTSCLQYSISSKSTLPVGL